jgi:diguanylate cyclase (GGDEF)-like protein
MGEFLRLPLVSSDDVVTARRLTSDVARVSGMASLDQTKLATVVSGLARRTFASSGHGKIVFSTDATTEGGLNLVVAVFDVGIDTKLTGTSTVSGGTTSRSGHRRLDSGSLGLLVGKLDHGTTPGGASYVTAAVQLSEVAARDPSLHERLGALRPRVTAPDTGPAAGPSGDLLALVATQAKELERTNALLERASADRTAANTELALTNRGVLDLLAELSAANESLVVSGAEMRQLADQQSALADLGHRAVASRDLRLFAVGLVSVLRRVLGIQGVGVLRFTPGKLGLDVLASEGCSPEQPTSIDLTRAQTRNLCRPGSQASDPALGASDIFLEVPGDARSCAVVAVHTPAGPWGVLVACDPEEGRFIGTAITFLEAAASLFAFSIARKASEDATRHSASHDHLTGLPNRSQLLDDLGRLLTDATDESVTAEGQPDKPGLAVIFIDIDGFKQVNDTLGHAAGDQVLIAATDRLHARARPDDVLARLGGDEFVVLCQGGGPAAPVIAKRLLSAFDEPFNIEGQDMFLSASAGTALAEAGVTSQQLLADADIAMYRAKKTPGSATVAFHPDMRALAESQSRLHNELPRAQERGQLRAVYQPIVDLHDGHVRGVEALLRWRHPELGDVPADVAVAAAERIGMAWNLTCWIAREAATAVRVWNTSNPGHTPLRLAVNFTPLLLEDPNRVAEFASHLTGAGLPLELLDVELTETAFADPTPDVLASIAELRGMGARLAMDDFGTGYSSLIALSNLPLDVLKIDRSFVTPLDKGGDSLLVSAMTFIAQGRTMETVAEGIETEGQLLALIAAGCDLGQGYLFSRPLEVSQLQGLAPYELEFADLIRQARSAALTMRRIPIPATPR